MDEDSRTDKAFGPMIFVQFILLHVESMLRNHTFCPVFFGLWGWQNHPFDAQNMIGLGFIGGQPDSFGKASDPFGVISYFDIGALPGQNRVFGISRDGTATASLGVFDVKGLIACVGKSEKSVWLRTIVNGAIINFG